MKKVILVLIAVCLIGCSLPKGRRHVDIDELKIKTDSLGLTAEQANIKKRFELSSNPDGLWWIYCLADNGQVVFYGPVKGKVTSSGKKLEIFHSNTRSYDGTNGESDSYVYWFDPQGIYYQWSGHYFLTSKEVKINNTVLNFRNE